MSYSDLYEAYKRCHDSTLSGKKIQANVNDFWKSLKQDTVNFPGNVSNKIKDLKATTTKKKINLLSFFTKVMFSIKI